MKSLSCVQVRTSARVSSKQERRHAHTGKWKTKAVNSSTDTANAHLMTPLMENGGGDFWAPTLLQTEKNNTLGLRATTLLQRGNKASPRTWALCLWVMALWRKQKCPFYDLGLGECNIGLQHGEKAQKKMRLKRCDGWNSGFTFGIMLQMSYKKAKIAAKTRHGHMWANKFRFVIPNGVYSLFFLQHFLHFLHLYLQQNWIIAMEKRIPRIPKPTAIPTAVELTLLPGNTEATRPQPHADSQRTTNK